VQPAVTGSLSDSTDRKSGRLLFSLIAVLALAGMIVSAVSLQRHYAKSATAFCDFSQRFSCDIVNRSEYSSIVGIPVAGIGVAGYAVLFVLAVFLKDRTATPNRLLAAALAGLVFALYLTYIEGYVLNAWCILCLISLLVIFLISVLAVVVKVRNAKS
jgi:vitamin-K-epoxide reductase (warfarin-sensitive)